MKILHIVESFNDQAIESWLIRMLGLAQHRNPEIRWTFYCTLPDQGKRDETVREMGAQLLKATNEISRPIAFMRSLRQTIRLGKFDVLHCHHDIMSALPLLASAGLGHFRVVHVHNTVLGLPTQSKLKALILRRPFQQVCLSADRVVGVSQDALDAILVGHKRCATRDRVIHCGIETDRFRRNETAVERIRHEMGFERSTKILLFVGRMIPYKNPQFVLRVLAHLHSLASDFAAVFAGTGPEEASVRTLAKELGLEKRVKVLGWRADVSALMHACDVLVWPGVEQPKEGLGLGVVEAQAAGLPVIMSYNVPQEAAIVPPLVQALPLSRGPKVWADAVLSQLCRPMPCREEARLCVQSSSFSMEQSWDSLLSLYTSGARPQPMNSKKSGFACK